MINYDYMNEDVNLDNDPAIEDADLESKNSIAESDDEYIQQKLLSIL